MCGELNDLSFASRESAKRSRETREVWRKNRSVESGSRTRQESVSNNTLIMITPGKPLPTESIPVAFHHQPRHPAFLFCSSTVDRRADDPGWRSFRAMGPAPDRF